MIAGLCMLLTAPAAEAPTGLHTARIEVVGFAEDAVLAALRLRLPALTISSHADAVDVYLKIVRSADGSAGSLQAITVDGRAYERSFNIEVGQEVRAVATTAVNLLYAIQRGDAVPDAQGVEIPVEVVEPAAAPVARPTEPQAIVPEPAATPIEVPAPRNVPLVLGPAWEAALVGHGAVVLGLGPPQQGGLPAAAGGGLGVDVRGPRGFAAALELRAAGVRHAEVGVARLRVGLGAGYVWRRGKFDLPVLLVLTVEPWWALLNGKADAVVGAGRRPLMGGHVRVAPGVRWTVRRGPLKAVRLGPRIEVGGGFVVDGGARVVGLTSADATPRARLGGLELALGLEVALQFAFRPVR